MRFALPPGAARPKCDSLDLPGPLDLLDSLNLTPIHPASLFSFQSKEPRIEPTTQCPTTPVWAGSTTISRLWMSVLLTSPGTVARQSATLPASYRDRGPPVKSAKPRRSKASALSFGQTTVQPIPPMGRLPYPRNMSRSNPSPSRSTSGSLELISASIDLWFARARSTSPDLPAFPLCFRTGGPRTGVGRIVPNCSQIVTVRPIDGHASGQGTVTGTYRLEHYASPVVSNSHHKIDTENKNS